MENNTDKNETKTRKVKFPALSQKNFYSLAEWMKANRAGIVEQRPTFASLALTASGALGFNVKGSDIANACDATGIEWTVPKAARIATLGSKRARRAHNDERFDTLARAVRELYAKLGEPLPDGFDAGVAPYAYGEPAAPTPAQLDAAADATRHAHRVAADNPAVAPKIGDAGRPKLPAPLVYAAEIGRPKIDAPPPRPSIDFRR
jgi:hypothetical protein